MTAPLDLAAIRERHREARGWPGHCEADNMKWPCDAAQLVAALEAAQADNERLRQALDWALRYIERPTVSNAPDDPFTVGLVNAMNFLVADRATGAEAET